MRMLELDVLFFRELLSAWDVADVEPTESCDILESFLEGKNATSCNVCLNILALKKQSVYRVKHSPIPLSGKSISSRQRASIMAVCIIPCIP